MWVVVVKFVLLILLTYSPRVGGDKTCAPMWFDCGNGKCLGEIWRCDGDDDCGNFNDERDCENPPIQNCSSNKFQCKSAGKHCIPEKWHCDGDKDCVDGSDEIDCNNETERCNGFACRNRQCLPSKWRCDGNDDCDDGSDEELCPQNKLCNDSEFLCSSGSCILQHLVCNGKKDCVDGSDEGSHCGDPCENATCSQNCKRTPTGPRCYCNDGYALDNKNNKTCNDVNECQQQGFCSHGCTNTVGGYTCSCQDGYELVNRTCLAAGVEPLLIYSTIKEVRGINLRANQFFSVATAVAHITAVDVDPKSQRVYWIELSNTSTIYTANFDGGGLRSVLNHGLLVPEDIAVDYITNKLYITDSGLRQVLACKEDGKMCHVLHANSEKPRSIALDPDNSLMYWSDWGEHSSGIYRSGMDGSRRISMVSNLIAWPNGIALDHTTNRLYWADAKLHTIEFITLDGAYRTVLLNTTVFHPYSLAIFEDTLYWSDWRTFSLESCNKFTGHKVTIMAGQNNRRIAGVHVYHPVLTSKVSNPCWSNDCSHMCLMSPVKEYTCVCPPGFALSNDQKTCIMCEEFFCSATSLCLPWSKVCDGKDDCLDASDEGGLCSTSCANGKDNCSDICQKTPQGSKCFCHEGFRLLDDKKTCEDVNECHEFGTCSQVCSNRKGSYECRCADGYRLKEDNRSCTAEGESPALVYILEDVIRGIDLETHSSKFHFNVKGANMGGFDYDVDEEVFYWTDLNEKSIKSYSTHTNSHDVIYRSCSKPVVVRYDWLARNLYFLDKKSDIGVCTRNGRICKTLIKSGGRRIDSMAISPPSGYMFWTIWASPFQRNRPGLIRRAEMDGSHVTNIILSEAFSPTALTVDPVLKLIYWADIKLKTFECANFNGLERRQIVQYGVHHPIASVVFEDHVYWTELNIHTVMRCHKFIEGRCENITDGNVKARDILVAHKVMQPKRNTSLCLAENGGCSHLCLTARNRRTCACSDSMTLDVDEQTCLGTCDELGMHRCRDGTCVKNYQICDGKEDCSDKEDELNCVPAIQHCID